MAVLRKSLFSPGSDVLSCAGAKITTSLFSEILLTLRLTS
jgi:hypothetical protein